MNRVDKSKTVKIYSLSRMEDEVTDGKYDRIELPAVIFPTNLNKFDRFVQPEIPW